MQDYHDNEDFFRCPIDMIEDVSKYRRWNVQRYNPHAIHVQIPKKDDFFSFDFTWNDDIGALLLTLTSGPKQERSMDESFFDILSEVNGRVWLGHFDWIKEEMNLVYRYTLLLHDTESLTLEMLEDVMDYMIHEWLRYLPTFTLMYTSPQLSKEAFLSSLVDPVGEA